MVPAATSAPAACASRPQRLDQSTPAAASSARSAAATDSCRVVRMRSRSRLSSSQQRASLAARSSSENCTPYQVPRTSCKTILMKPCSSGEGWGSTGRPSSTTAPVVTTGPSRVMTRAMETRKRSSRHKTNVNAAHANCRSRQNASAASTPTWAPRQRARCSRASSERAWGQGRISLA